MATGAAPTLTPDGEGEVDLRPLAGSSGTFTVGNFEDEATTIRVRLPYADTDADNVDPFYVEVDSVTCAGVELVADSSVYFADHPSPAEYATGRQLILVRPTSLGADEGANRWSACWVNRPPLTVDQLGALLSQVFAPFGEG